jgi:hypothetical protein
MIQSLQLIEATVLHLLSALRQSLRCQKLWVKQLVVAVASVDRCTLCDLELGLLPTSAIIGGGMPIAAGAALAFQFKAMTG